MMLKRNISLFAMGSILCIVFILCIFMIPNILNVQAIADIDDFETLSQLDNGIYEDEYTGIEEKANGIPGYASGENAEHYAGNVEWETGGLSYSGDDPIVNFIPRELFTQEGKHYILADTTVFL